MKISVIIPVYNVEQYIEKCLSSVMQQTFTGSLECIVVDDCGNDNSIAIAQRIIDSYNGPFAFKIIHHEKNGGLSAARNTGTKASSGDYVYYLDSDDEITPSCIQLLTDAANCHPNVDVVQGATLTIPVDDPFYSIKQFNSTTFVADNNWIRQQFYKINNGLPVNAWNKLIRRQFIEDNSLWFKEGIIHEDQHWMFFAVKRMQSIAFVHDVTYIHQRNNESIMKASSKAQSEQHWGIILREISQNIDSPQQQLQVFKYTTALVTRYNPSSDYDFARNILIQKMKELHLPTGFFLANLWANHNNFITRILIRRYCKFMAKRK
ncbi:MAG: glycosyltransferase [Bacteroidales bacterium]|nr:glycosyltransferase [Bacteroidales bacterium]